MLIQICILIRFALGQFSIIPILYSDYTSPLLLMYFKTTLDCSTGTEPGCNLDSPFRFILYKITDLSDIETVFENPEYFIVYDTVSSLAISSMINTYARTLGFIHFIVGYPVDISLSSAYYSDYSFSSYTSTALSIAKTYNIKKVIVLISSEFSDMSFDNDQGIEIVGQFVLPQTASYEYISWLISKKIKPMGIKWFFFKTNKEISEKIQEALVEADMNKKGYTYVYIQEAAWGAYLEGSILLEGKWFHSTDTFSYINNLVYYGSIVVYNLIANNPIQGSFSGYILNDLVAQVLKPEVMGYTIWNIQGGKVQAVGVINGNGLQIQLPVMFPGKTYEAPNNNNIEIPISISGVTYENYINDGLNMMNQIGVNLATETIITEGDLLPNFDIVVNNITDCSFTDNNSTFKCFSDHLDDLGYFHIPRLETSTVLATMEVFQKNNILTPVLGVQTSTILSTSKYYPQYSRVSYPNSRTASAAALILSVFGISKCSLLYSDSQWGEDYYSEFQNQTDSYGIHILNKNKAVSPGFKGSNKKIIQEIIDLKTRYVVLEVQWPDILYVIEAFYDLGMREGDIYLIVGDGMISKSDLDEKLIGSKSYNKRKEMMSGLIYISFVAFENQLGFNLKSKISSKYGAVYDYMCLFYDAAYLGLYTIDALINWGANVNSSTIEETIREVAFTGCSGVVRVSQEGNDRLNTVLGIYNLIQVNSTWTMNLCGLYDPGQLIVLQIRQPISWNSNGDVPSDIIGDDQECPFRDILVQSFLYGYFILIIIELIPMIIGTLFAIKFYNFIFKQKYPKLTTAQKENFLDILSYITFMIESLQYMQIGPDFTAFFPKWSDATKITTLYVRGYFKKGIFTFWNQIIFYETLGYLWFLLFLWKIFKIGKDSDHFILTAVNELNFYIMPIIGEILFLPINLYLFQTFQCTSSIGDNFKDSFNNQDCSTFCWQGEHITYVIISALAISVYLPTSLYFRFTWKNDFSFHFQEQPFHIALKSAVQIILIALVTIVSPASENVSLGLCIGLLLLYVIISIIKKPLTYDRASLWYTIFIAFSLILWCCCALAKTNKEAALITLVIGWIVLAMLGAIYQKLKLPCLLESERGINIYKLFRFQLLAITPEAAGISKIEPFKYIYADESPHGKEIKSPSMSKSPRSFLSEEDNLKSSIQLFDINNENAEHLGEFNSSWCSNKIAQK
ncbi:unnamed protein product [Blepharisma stoltei]|uniref:Receptor ligand binding region domain-containing protein n=1 Tax=Blepharisma stoltei TaxID=1481888 RepID=A0AAU9K4H0_9CILI|nr:unnamed protein product [Blepharisma stoltei]